MKPGLTRIYRFGRLILELTDDSAYLPEERKRVKLENFYNQRYLLVSELDDCVLEKKLVRYHGWKRKEDRVIPRLIHFYPPGWSASISVDYNKTNKTECYGQLRRAVDLLYMWEIESYCERRKQGQKKKVYEDEWEEMFWNDPASSEPITNFK